MKKPRSKKKIIISVLCVLLALAVLTPCAINAAVMISASKYIISADEAVGRETDCVLVLGARVNSNGTLSHMLEDRMSTGVDLYQAGAGKKILASGDHGRDSYDEVNHMKQYAVGRGVDPDDVFLDHAGFSTYESMYTQKYHLYRAVYNARRLGIDAYGVAADKRVYGKPVYNFVRESLARCKDFFMCIFKPEPTYLGEVIPISGSASLSDDTEY